MFPLKIFVHIFPLDAYMYVQKAKFIKFCLVWHGLLQACNLKQVKLKNCSVTIKRIIKATGYKNSIYISKMCILICKKGIEYLAKCIAVVHVMTFMCTISLMHELSTFLESTTLKKKHFYTAASMKARNIHVQLQQQERNQQIKHNRIIRQTNNTTKSKRTTATTTTTTLI